MTQFKSLLDFVVECSGGTVVLIHAACGRIIDEWPGDAPTLLDDIVRSAADHDCDRTYR